MFLCCTGETHLTNMSYKKNIFVVFSKTELLPLKKLLERPPVGKTCSSYTNVLLEPEIFHLMFNSVTFPVMRFFGLIWFNAADVMWSTLHQFVYQLIGLSLKQTGAHQCTAYEQSLVLKFRNFITHSLRKQPTFCDATTAQKFHTDDVSLPWSERCFWLVKILLQPIRSTTQIRVVTRHQYGISALVPQTSFPGETIGGVAKKFRLHYLHKTLVA